MPSLARKNRSAEERNEVLSIGTLLVDLYESRWLACSILLLTVLAAAFYSLMLEPIFRTDALVQVENNDRLPTVESVMAAATPFESEASVTAEIEILQSRMVLGSVVDDLGLQIVAEPRRFPLLGPVVTRLHDPAKGVRKPWLGLGSFAWGGERIHVDSMEIPDDAYDRNWTLEAIEDGGYRLFDSENREVVAGTVGQTAKAAAGDLPRLFVSRLDARPGTRFRLIKHSRQWSIRQLQEGLKVREKGKQSGVMTLALEGADPRRVSETLSQIVNLYVRQNVERRSVEAEQTLAFLDEQLPSVKRELETAESLLNKYRLEKGSIDLPLETQAILAEIVEIQAGVTELEQRRAGLRQNFTAAHPTIMAVDAELTRLNQGLDDMNSQVRNLPETQQEVLRLSRDVQVNTALYTALLNSSQELRVTKAGMIGNARILDQAIVPDRPVRPRKMLIVAAGVLLGICLATLMVVARKHLMPRGVENPDELEQTLGFPVYASVPNSKKQREIARQAKRNGSAPAILASLDPEDLAIESLRSTHTALQFAMLEAKNNLIMICGPRPGVGKSFISVNLSAVLAMAGKKVLLIDGDMRKGLLHEHLGVKRKCGLSDVIGDRLDTAEAIKPTAIDGLELITTGTPPPNPYELLLRDRFVECMESLSARYDQIIVDSPPVLAVADANIIGQAAGTSLLVLRSGQHSLDEIKLSVKRLKQAGVDLNGLMFNGVKLNLRKGHGKYAFQYAYRKN